PRADPFESSALFAEWRELHLKYGTNAESMPTLYKAIDSFKDLFHKQAFHAEEARSGTRNTAALSRVAGPCSGGRSRGSPIRGFWLGIARAGMPERHS